VLLAGAIAATNLTLRMTEALSASCLRGANFEELLTFTGSGTLSSGFSTLVLVGSILSTAAAMVLA